MTHREYQMYHGERVPGFPQHPHRGFETITATMEGLVDHTDSVGNAGRYGQGDVQWMTAGKGIVHGEMFPLVNDDAPNPLRLFQIWLNLPARSKMVDTAFVMHWAEDVQSVTETDAGYELVVWAGELLGCKGQKPPPASWAADANNDVAVYFVTVHPGGAFTLPPSKIGAVSNRYAYFFEGDAVEIDARAIPAKSAIEIGRGRRGEDCRPGVRVRVRVAAGAAGTAHRGAGGAARALRHEHQGGDHAGVFGLPEDAVRRLAVAGGRGGVPQG